MQETDAASAKGARSEPHASEVNRASAKGARSEPQASEVNRQAPRIRATPEDFQVDEIPLYPASGEGGHTFLYVEKRLRTTEQVARELARLAAVPARDVGYAGRKDRMALTRQWFSVPALEPERALDLELRGARVLSATRHGHKLRTGQLRANRFAICVREVGADVVERAQRALDEIVRVGFPNRFGSQRFGREGDNATAALALLRGKAPRGERRAARFLISALQAAVFNEVLAQRPLSLDRVEVGDLAVVNASGGLFLVEDAERENARAGSFEISATGPIFGTRVREPVGAVADREAAVLADFGVPVGAELRLPRGIRARGTRRALRSRPADVHVQAEGRDVWLRFALPAGSYATVLLEEVFGPLRVDHGASTVESAAAPVGDQGYARRSREDAPR